MTNSDFLAEVYGQFDLGEYGWVCSFRASPASEDSGKWGGRPYKGLPQQAALIDRATDDNTYFSTAVLRATEDGEVVRRKEAFVRLAVLVLDDVQLSDVQGFSYAIQTSPGKHQVGIFLDGDDADARNRQLVDRVMSALAARGRSNDASGNACVRYVRLPGGTNTKPRAAGDWKVQLEVWSPNIRWSLDDACSAVGIDLDALRHVEAKAQSTSTHGPSPAGELYAGIMDQRLEQRAYHDSIVRMAASLVAGGMFPGAAVEHLYSLMDAARPDMRNAEEYRRWEARRAEIPRAVKSAEKFAPEERQTNVTVNLRLPGAEPESGPEQPRELAPMDWGVLAGVEPEPTSWALDGWLPDGTVTLLSAHGGVGKSNLSLQLAVALGVGQSFIGLDAEQRRVMVLSGEDEARTVHFRVANICADAGVDMLDLRGCLDVYDMTKSDCVLWRDGRPTERMQWLADTADACGAGVIVIDNASDVFADNENDRTAVRGFMRCLNMIAGATGAAVLLLAHVDKASVRAGAGLDSNTTFSGSTAWNNSARSRWAMVRDSDRQVMLRHEKCNLGPLQEEIGLEFDAGAKVFKRFGTVPGAAAADMLVRNTQRAAILRLIGSAASAGANLSMRSNAAHCNIFTLLRDEPEFPQKMNRRAFYALLRDLEIEKLIAEVDYVKPNRMKGQRVVLTPAGEARVAVGSGAPPMWKQREEDDGEE